MQQTKQTSLQHLNTSRFKSNILIQQNVLSNRYQYFVNDLHQRVLSRLFDSYLNNPALLSFHSQPFKTVPGFLPYRENTMRQQQNLPTRILQTKDNSNNHKKVQSLVLSSQIDFSEGNNKVGLTSSFEENKYINPIQIIKKSESFQKTSIDLVPQIVTTQKNHWLQNTSGQTQLYKKIRNSSFKIYQHQPNSKSQTSNSKHSQPKKQTSETALNQILESQVLKVDALPKSQKTTNIPKFLLKIFLNFYQTDVKQLAGNPDNLQKVKNYFTKLKNRKKNMNVRALRNLLLKNQIDKSQPGMTRKLMFYILNKRKKQEIIMNKKIVMKKFYLLSSKIYRIRCQSSALVERLSIR